jgi:hypothetical protein
MRVVQRPTEMTLSSGNTYRFRKGDRLGIAPPVRPYPPVPLSLREFRLLSISDQTSSPLFVPLRLTSHPATAPGR